MKKSIKNYLTLLFLATVWGSSFILMKKGLIVFSDVQVAALRLFIAFLSLVPFLFQAFKKVSKKRVRNSEKLVGCSKRFVIYLRISDGIR